MYYIDTPTREVVSFDYNLATGQISNKRIAVSILKQYGSPDGMTTDVEGNIWVAEFNGYRVSRWNPFTGELLESIEIPVAQVTSCIFGGADMDELFITTSKYGLTEKMLKEQPFAGKLIKVKTSTRGIKSYRFAG
jgi:sugar lactone lactonase YvrE